LLGTSQFCRCASSHHRRPPLPTRRSSDLSSPATRATSSAGTTRLTRPSRSASAAGRSSPKNMISLARCSPTRRGSSQQPPPSGRSEEHTSELQSRENLVCRLLLEKKNHQT